MVLGDFDCLFSVYFESFSGEEPFPFDGECPFVELYCLVLFRRRRWSLTGTSGTVLNVEVVMPFLLMNTVPAGSTVIP